MTSIAPASFSSPHFKWKDPFLTIKTTDTASPQEPPILEKSTSIESDDPRWRERDLKWRTKLGEVLVKDYLAIDPGQHKNTKKYMLAKFPRNYVFYVHQRAQKAQPRDGKPKPHHYDSYLSGGGHMFRSPNEFVFHAAWLIDGAVPGGCICVYCDPSIPGQRHRTQALEGNRRKVSQRIRELKNSGANIKRELNALNRKAFLKPRPAQGTSFEMDNNEEDGDEETDTNSSSNGDSVGGLVDEESDQDTEMEE